MLLGISWIFQCAIHQWPQKTLDESWMRCKNGDRYKTCNSKIIRLATNHCFVDIHSGINWQFGSDMVIMVLKTHFLVINIGDCKIWGLFINTQIVMQGQYLNWWIWSCYSQPTDSHSNCLPSHIGKATYKIVKIYILHTTSLLECQNHWPEVNSIEPNTWKKTQAHWATCKSIA